MSLASPNSIAGNDPTSPIESSTDASLVTPVGTTKSFINRFSASGTLRKMGLSTEVLSASHTNLEKTKEGIPGSVSNLNLDTFVRSRSSFSFNLFNHFEFFQEAALVRKSSLDPSKSPLKYKNVNSPVDEDGFLREIESNGFPGIWNHPITRCYFLMYLISTGNAPVYFFRQDALNFRQEFASMYPAQRKITASRIYNTYLSSKHASLPIKLGHRLEREGGIFAINSVRINLDNPDANLFDDVAYISLRTLQDLYDGDFMETPNQTSFMEDEESCRLLFIQSAFYQAMQNDLRGTKHLTSIQYKRAAERLMDMPSHYFQEETLSEKLVWCLESIGIDVEPLRIKYGKTNKKDNLRITSTLKGKSMDEIFMSKETKMPSLQFGNMLNASGDYSHTFVQYLSNNQKFCEYCFGAADGKEEGQAVYRCESCGYYCHKACRNSVNVSCVKASASLQIDHGSDVVHSEKVKKIEEKIQAIQKEIDIELKIRDGLDKMVKAKEHLTRKSKKTSDADVSSQLERSNKKLDVLKHELQKYRLQLVEAQKVAETTASMEPVDDQNNEGSREVIKVAMVDPTTKTESTKLFSVHEAMTARTLILAAVPKFSLTGPIDSYSLMYKSEHGDEVPLRMDDLLLSAGIQFSQHILTLKPRLDYEYYDLDASQKDISSINKRQQEVFDEILETEEGYNADLQTIIAASIARLNESFLVPIEAFNCLRRADFDLVFSNVEDIAASHRELVQKLIVKKSSPISLSALLDQFDHRIEDWTRTYMQYCSNVDSARRTLNRLKADVEFTKILQQCESDPKLRKLTLSDLIMKPMHRITRYPLLFKRLLSHTKPGSELYSTIDQVINKFDRMVTEINENVRRTDAEKRIHVIEENLDFNSICEPFKIANGPRELISEHTFSYVKKNSSGTNEVVLLLFTDMILILKVKKTEQYQLMRLPIPFESAVFLDKMVESDGGKKMFQIVHLQHEIHLLEASSASKKNAWLLEAESLRIKFCSYYYEYELSRGNRTDRIEISRAASEDKAKRRNTTTQSTKRTPSSLTFQELLRHMPEPPVLTTPTSLKRASSMGNKQKVKSYDTNNSENSSLKTNSAGALSGSRLQSNESLLSHPSSTEVSGEKEKTHKILIKGSSDIELTRSSSEDNSQFDSPKTPNPLFSNTSWSLSRKTARIRQRNNNESTLPLPAHHLQNKLGGDSCPSLPRSGTDSSGEYQSSYTDISSIIDMSISDNTSETRSSVSPTRRLANRLSSFSRELRKSASRGGDDVNSKLHKLFM